MEMGKMTCENIAFAHNCLDRTYCIGQGAEQTARFLDNEKSSKGLL